MFLYKDEYIGSGTDNQAMKNKELYYMILSADTTDKLSFFSVVLDL